MRGVMKVRIARLTFGLPGLVTRDPPRAGEENRTSLAVGGHTRGTQLHNRGHQHSHTGGRDGATEVAAVAAQWLPQLLLLSSAY